MDEPSTGLDPASRNNLWQVVKDAKKDRAIILTSQCPGLTPPPRFFCAYFVLLRCSFGAYFVLIVCLFRPYSVHNRAYFRTL
jgi:hypothetical protein